MFQNFTPQQLKAHLDTSEIQPVLLDVRESWEYKRCHITGSQHIPMGQLITHIEDLDPKRETVVICHHGVRSWKVAQFLRGNGFTKIINLAGGVARWAKEVDHDMPTY